MNRRGVVYGIIAYALWGVLPLFWRLLSSAGALETLAHRIVWSGVMAAVLLAITGAGFSWIRPALSGGRLPLLVMAAVVVAVNWGLFIWAVNTNHVVEASLGYFINPLINVVFGLIFFAEKLSRRGLVGVLVALAGVMVISAEHLTTLWISLALAVSFGIYGVIKKRLTIPALQSLVVESAVLAPLSIGYLVWFGTTGRGQFGVSLSMTVLFIAAGLVTLAPLWFFASAAQRLGLGVLGILQYIGPTLQFLIGLLVFGQRVSASYWVGLVIVWVGCAVYLTTIASRPRPGVLVSTPAKQAV